MRYKIKKFNTKLNQINTIYKCFDTKNIYHTYTDNNLTIIWSINLNCEFAD